MMSLNNFKPLVKGVLLATVLLLGIFYRLQYFDQEGGDQTTYKDTVLSFAQGENIYINTVASFEAEGKHGYAYLPSLLYVQYAFYYINNIFDLDLPMRQLWKIPVMIADVGIVLLLAWFLHKKSYWVALFAGTYWLFNPHIFIRGEYTLYDPLALFFLLLMFLFFPRQSFLSGLMVAIAVSFKTFPIMLLPILLLKTKSIPKFILGGILVAFIISLPFMVSYYDFTTYIKGALFVHQDRGIQGRPVLTTLSYYLRPLGIDFKQDIYFTFYAYSTLILAAFVPVMLHFKKNLGVFTLVALSIFIYMLITPVLSRTHVLWVMPFALIGVYDYLSSLPFTSKLSVNMQYFVVMMTFYFIVSVHLFFWHSGIKIANDSAGARYYESSQVDIKTALKNLVRVKKM